LRLLARGFPYSGIALQLGITRNTAAGHLKNAYRKLAVRSGPAAVMRAVELGLFSQA
jgi:DNA-binding CsgD family transcriptional regulator